MTDLLPMAVAVPILAAVVALLAGLARSESGWPVAVAGMVAHLALAAELGRRVFADGRIEYVVGGFEAPYGIELALDGLSATILLLVAVVGLGVLAYARRAGPRSNPFYSGYLLLMAGLSGMTITADVFNMYVFLEITGLAAYALVASGDRGRSAVAALRYLLIGTVGASLFLLGIGYAYIGTGTLNMVNLAEQLADLGYKSTLARASFALISVGLLIKVALFPLHTWQPEAYAGAPDTVSGLISALVSTVSAYAFVRIVFTVFTVDFLAANPLAQQLLGALAAASIVLGSVLAVSQTEIKRMLAYSSVAQFGLVIAAASVANPLALTGAVVHLVGHAVMKGGLFLAAGLVATATGARSISEYDGLAERLPVGAKAFAALALAMVGVPPAVGFVGKWYIALGAVEAGSWPLAAVIVASTLLTLAYFARLVERMFFREPAGTDDPETADSAAPDPDAESAGNAGAVADGGGDAATPATVSLGMYAVVVAAAVLAVVLGAAVFQFGAFLEPTIDTLLS